MFFAFEASFISIEGKTRGPRSRLVLGR